MLVVGGVVSGIALAGLLLSIWRRWIPIGHAPLGSERREVWLGAAGVYAVGVAFVLDWWYVGLALPVLVGIVAGRSLAKRWDWTVLLAVTIGLIFGVLSLSPFWWVGVAVGVVAAVLLFWRAGDLLVVAEQRPRILGAKRTWWIFVVLAATLGLLSGLDHRSAGVLACGLAAGALAAYIVAADLGSSSGWIAAGILVALAAGPVLAWFDADRPVVELVLAAVATLTVAYFGIDIYREKTGPFDAQSPRTKHPFDDTPIEWAWVGAVTTSSATITARVRPGVTIDEKNIKIEPSGRIENKTSGLKRDPAHFELTELPDDKRCTLTISAAGASTLHAAEVAFRTFPSGRKSVRIAVGSCASTGSRARVFERIRELDVNVFAHLGDLHYENIELNEPSVFHAAYDSVLASPPQAALFSSTPIACIWDDHNFGPNNSDKSSPSAEASKIAYHEVEPHYPLRASAKEPHDHGPGAVYQHFTIGPVRVVLTDTRSERTPAAPGNKFKNGSRNDHRREIMSASQQTWLIQTVEDAKNDPSCELVVWCCSTPWIGSGDDPDIWEGFAQQRKEIFDELRMVGMELVYVSGDAHMIGIDDGTNSTTNPIHHGFPVLAAASLDRRPSRKGAGQYSFASQGESENPWPGFGQFGIIDVDASGEKLKVTLQTQRQGNVAHEHVVDFRRWLAGAIP